MKSTPEVLMEQYASDYMEKVYYFCLRKCGDPFEAEDLASEITYEIMAALRKGTLPQNFAGWVWRIARNRYSRWADAKNRRSQLISGDELPAEPGIPDEDDGTDPERGGAWTVPYSSEPPARRRCPALGGRRCNGRPARGGSPRG